MTLQVTQFPSNDNAHFLTPFQGTETDLLKNSVLGQSQQKYKDR